MTEIQGKIPSYKVATYHRGQSCSEGFPSERKVLQKHKKHDRSINPNVLWFRL
jgi:hypothetical protein